MKILVTGSAGFIGGYLVEELLSAGHEVYGIDNYSKYGEIRKTYDNHPRYHFTKADVKDIAIMKELTGQCDQVVAAAAMIGGISYFHHYAYDLLAENERILASTCDAALWAFRNKTLSKINILSSSMVFENSTLFPTPEGAQANSPPPASTYGFQKLSCEYFAKGAWEQYKLPYTIIRPFNCIGTGEHAALQGDALSSGNKTLAMSHVVPDLIAKILSGQDPLRILGSGNQIRHYTYGDDLAKGIRLCIERPEAINEDFNISTGVSTTVEELATLLWKKIKGDKPLRIICDEPFCYDVQKRIPDVSKAKRILGYEALTPLSNALDEIISWIKASVKSE
jgi:nucleoside-diphosphate-sugar epimerase